ncbi:hypothetical protein F4680DRAFT_364496 [Xylaria scruposa]|nr:hypothetical protein F4680DRAFT_364496 [Xylaria scruposa]
MEPTRLPSHTFAPDSHISHTNSVSSLGSSRQSGSPSFDLPAPLPKFIPYGIPGRQFNMTSSHHPITHAEGSKPVIQDNTKNSAIQPIPVSRGPWKPSYLDKRRLVVFPLVFFGFIVTIQALIRVSHDNDGLGTSNRKLHYLWTFGPMAALTLVAAFWARVEFQLKSVAPWAHMVEGQSFERTLLLDYLSMLQPICIFKAFKYRDWVVASASLCSLVLRITTILSTALFVFTATEVRNTPVSVSVLSRFVDNTTELDGLATRLGSLPYYSMLGLSERNMSFPDGASGSYAFQQFVATDIPDAHLSITVEGFMSNLTCQPAALNTSYGNCDSQNATELCWALETSQCQYPIHPPNPEESDDGSIPHFHGTIDLSGCNGSQQANDVVLYIMFGKLRLSDEQPISGFYGFSQSSQIICRASYTVDTVDVISNHTGVISVSKSKTGPSRKITKLSEGKMLEIYLESFATKTIVPFGPILNATGDTGEPETMQLVPIFANVASFAGLINPPVSSLLNDSFLEEILNSHYRQNAVFIARSVFSTRTSQSITGKIDLKKERLIVSAATGHALTSTFSITLILSLFVIFKKGELPHLPKSPSSVIRIIQLLADSKEVLSLLAGAGPASLSTLRNRLREFHCRSTNEKPFSNLGGPVDCFRLSLEPNEDVAELHYLDAPSNTMKTSLVLNPISLTVVHLVIVGVIVALEVIVRVSGPNNDFVDVSDLEYIHLVWTILPALLLSLISMYFSSVDMEIRSLTPFSKLSKGSSLSQMAKLDLLDGSTVRLLWREYRTDCLAALATSACLLTSSFFTIFVGSLYSVVTLPINTPITLKTNSSFVSSSLGEGESQGNDLENFPDFSSITTNLILQNNLSYPSFTYENLAFPIFSVPDALGDFSLSSSDTVNATVPALRSRMSCTRYSSSEIEMEVTSGRIPFVPVNHQSDIDILAINIDGEQHQSTTIPSGLTHNVELPLNGRPGANWVFGIGESCNGDDGTIWCTSDFLYVWGRKTNSSDQSRNHVAALTCNESVEAVDVSTTFFGSQLRIDPSLPPHPINDSARASTVDIHTGSAFTAGKWLSPYLYLSEGVEAPGSYLFPFFNLLTASRYGVSQADLEDPEKDEAVAYAIIFQHGIIRAQVLNEGFRGPANMTNATLANPPANPATANDAKLYNGTVSRAGGRRRLSQDPATTRVLEALLGAALLLSLAGRLLMPNTRLLPRNATSIANVAALVADGNVLHILPENAALLSDDEIVASNRGAYILRLGWWASTDGDGARQRFGIFAMKTSQESMFD